MKYVDLNVTVKTQSVLEQVQAMSESLGYSALAVCGLDPKALAEAGEGVFFSRFNLMSKRRTSLKKEAARMRGKHIILSQALGGIDVANWAASEGMIDLLTLSPSNNNKLRETTAKLASNSGTALEVPIRPLLNSFGLERSRVIKAMSDAIKVARQGRMKVVLSSGAHDPIHLRSPRAMVHIGMVLGLSQKESTESIHDTPMAIISRSLKRLDKRYLLHGLEIVGDKP